MEKEHTKAAHLLFDDLSLFTLCSVWFAGLHKTLNFECMKASLNFLHVS